MATSPNGLQHNINNSIINLFLNSYDIKESKRKDAVTTKEQGALTIEKADGPLTDQQKNIINLLKFIGQNNYEYIEQLFGQIYRVELSEMQIKEQIVINIKGTILGMQNYMLPPRIDIQYMTETIHHFWNNYLVLFGGIPIKEGFIRFTLKRFYCYCTGGKIVHEIQDGREKFRGNINYIRLTGSHGPRAEVEHIIGWRMMLTVGGDLATSTNFSEQVEISVHKNISEDGTVERYKNNTRANPWTEEDIEFFKKKGLGPAKMRTETSFGRDSLWNPGDWGKAGEEDQGYDLMVFNLHKIISKFGGLPSFHSAALNHNENRELFRDMFRRDADLGENFLLNIEQIIHNGYWYSNRLFNQIKGSMSIFSLTRQTFYNGEESLFFRVSHTRLNFLCNIFLAYIYNAHEDGRRKLISNYDEYLSYKNNWDGEEWSFDNITEYVKAFSKDDLKPQREERGETDEESGRQYDLMHYYLNGIYKINNDITKQEWEWLRDICIGFGDDINSAKRHLMKNLIYIGDQLVSSLNENMEMRIYFQSKRKGQGLKFTTKGATSGMGSAHGARVAKSFGSPKNRKTSLATALTKLNSVNAKAVQSSEHQPPAAEARENFILYFEQKHGINQGGSGNKTRKRRRKKKKRTRRKK